MLKWVFTISPVSGTFCIVSYLTLNCRVDTVRLQGRLTGLLMLKNRSFTFHIKMTELANPFWISLLGITFLFCMT